MLPPLQLILDMKVWWSLTFNMLSCTLELKEVSISDDICVFTHTDINIGCQHFYQTACIQRSQEWSRKAPQTPGAPVIGRGVGPSPSPSSPSCSMSLLSFLSSHADTMPFTLICRECSTHIRNRAGTYTTYSPPSFGDTIQSMVVMCKEQEVYKIQCCTWSRGTKNISLLWAYSDVQCTYHSNE